MTIIFTGQAPDEGIGMDVSTYARAIAGAGARNAEATVSFTLLKTLAVV